MPVQAGDRAPAISKSAMFKAKEDEVTAVYF